MARRLVWYGATVATVLGLAVVGWVWAHSGEPPESAETVVVVHGLGRTPQSMSVLGARLRTDGYRVVFVGYPSRSTTVEQLADTLAARVEACCGESAGEVHFVTHSMGGILVRTYLSTRPGHRGRVVMLSPPNQGSEVVDVVGPTRLGPAVLGPAGQALGTDTTGVTGRLGPVDFELGIITGTRSVNPIGSGIIPGPDDGAVSVESARVEGAADFLVLPATHTFIMNRRDVALAVSGFLAEGRFPRGDGPDLESS